MGKKIILSAFLVMVILVSSVYFVLNDEVRIDIQKTKSIFQVYENGEWVVSGVEYVNLFDGTAKMRAKNRSLETIIGENNITTVTRIANYKDGISTIEIYIFNPNVNDVELFPISHSINVINGEGKLLQYEVQKLLYTGETVKNIKSPQKFGHKMVVEWDDGNYYSKIYKYKNKNEGKLTIKYRIDSANYLKNVRLFDPDDLTTDLVSYWKLDDSSGEAVDSTGSNNGTVVGANYSESGKINTAYSFDGINDQITMGTLGTFGTNMGNGVSVGFWINTTETGKNTVMGASSTTGNQFIKVAFNWGANTSADEGKLKFNVRDESAVESFGYTTSDVVFNDGNWHYIVMTYNISEEIKIYLDGSNQSLTTTYSGASNWSENFANSWIGSDSVSYWTRGIFDEIGFWSRVLSQSEVTELYNEGNGLAYPFTKTNVTLNSPSDGYISDTKEVEFNCSATGLDLVNSTGFLWNTDGSLNQSNITIGLSGNDNTKVWNFTLIDQTTYNWSCQYCNNNSNCEFADENRTVSLDKTFPYISIKYPLNKSYSENVSELNYSVTDAFGDKCWYSKDNGVINSSKLTFSQNFTKVISVEGYNDWIVYCNDTAGNENNSNVTFLKDIGYPRIDYSSNSDESNSSGIFSQKDWIFINVTVVEVLVSNVTFKTWTSINSSFNTTIYMINKTYYTLNQTNLDENIYFWNVTVCDTLNRCNYTDNRYYGIEKLNFTINGSLTNQNAELGVNINISANNTYDYVFIDVDHPSYGINYSVGVWSTTFDLIIDWFRKTAFNDSTTSKELEYTGTEIKNVYFSSHQYDEVVNMSINISGTNTTQYPKNVLINSSNTSTIDRYFPGSLIGNNIFLDKDANNDSTINLTYTNIAPQTINMFMDDNAILSNFTFNITGVEFGVDFIDYLTNLSYINIISSDGQINDAGVIMPANSTLKNLLWDNFNDASVDSDKWDVSADFSQSTGSGIDCSIERHVTEQNGEIRLRAENSHNGNDVVGCAAGSSYIIANTSKFNLYNSDNIIVEMNASTVTESDGDDCDGAVYVYLGNTEVWQGNPLFDTIGTSRSDAKIIFNFTKINSTSWSAHLTGYESYSRHGASALKNWTSNLWTLTNGTVKPLTNPFIVEVTYFSILPLVLLAEDDASELNCKSSFSNGYFNFVNNSLWNRNNGSIISESIYDSSGTITDATFNVTGFLVTNNETVNLFMSANNGDNWEAVTNGLEHSFVYTGNHLKWKIDFNMTETGYKNISSYIGNINITTPKGYPTNISIDFGNDDIADFSFSGELNNTNSPMIVNVSSADISASLLLDPLVGNHLNIVPLEITSGTVGSINIDSFSLFYNPNPVFLDTSAIYNFINSSIGFIDFPISIESIGGNITFNDIRFDYAGGNDTIAITAHNNDSSVNITRNITYYYSRWDYKWGPSNVEWIYFAPNTPTSVNITPYGQTSDTPILNITNYGYGGKNATLSVYQNGSSNCVNTTISLNSSKEYGFLLNDSFIDIVNLSYLENASIYLWADYSCSYNTWNLFEPQYYFRQCVDGGICSTELI